MNTRNTILYYAGLSLGAALLTVALMRFFLS
jgi:hypothetical protein